MSSPSSPLDKIANDLFPILKREISAIQDEIRSAENRIERIPRSLLSDNTRISLDNCKAQLYSAHTECVGALKAVHQQYPH